MKTIQQTNDYGSDPMGDKQYKMIPSGDIVAKDERDKRLANVRRHVKNDCLGLSWEQIETIQGGKLTR